MFDRWRSQILGLRLHHHLALRRCYFYFCMAMRRLVNRLMDWFVYRLGSRFRHRDSYSMVRLMLMHRQRLGIGRP
ncbi:hypothetical protein GCM10011585_17650 [Edaphobacter dinghuensis]|uniref:Uncharacterized protein n=1 Tax=Edaphobacter dinghuensis TaxID=1560005 RepID=A0A917HDF9_9BACT|nr:hypothetical protein GCM10011585_17650 [Edaphobacter dinghuensis]